MEAEHAETVTEFIWKELYDVRVARKCDLLLEIKSALHTSIATEIVNRSQQKLQEYQARPYKKLHPEMNQFVKCLFFRNFKKEFHDTCDQTVKDEINRIKAVQQDVAQETLHIMLIDKSLRENPVLIVQMTEIFNLADSAFQLQIIDLVNTTDDEAFFMVQIGLFYAKVRDTGQLFPANVRILKVIYFRREWQRAEFSAFQENFRELRHRDYFYTLKGEDASELMLLIIKYELLSDFIELIEWLSIEYPFILRRFNVEIREWCWKKLDSIETFQVIRHGLMRTTQSEFLDVFCEKLENSDLRYGGSPLPCDDRFTLNRLRSVIRRHLLDPKSCNNMRGLGALVAAYGEARDLEEGLELNNHEFLTGFLMTPSSSNIFLTSAMKATILERSKECLLYYFSPNCRAEQPKTSGDFHRAYCLRNGAAAEILDIVEGSAN
jgi:hypothetical protein